MTATERLFRGDSDEFLSMDDPRDYGSLIYELSFKEAINSKPPIISDYKIITFGITTPEIEEIYQSNKYLEVKKILKDITAREFATAIALRKAIKKLKIKNAISFHRSIRRADNFRVQQDLITKIFPSYGKLKSFHVRGDMPTSDRAIQMRNFAEGEGLMTNARCLTEGVDLPAIDCVVFTDPKRSKVDIVQAAGRALRLSKGKKFGYILIPIFIPDGADFNEAAEEQGFDDVAVTVRALATTDTRITEYLRIISEGKKPRGGSPVDGITSVNSLYKIEAEEFDKAIKLKIWDKVAPANYRTYQETKKFAQSLKIKNKDEWFKLSNTSRLSKDIPIAVSRYYKYTGWLSWAHFLGNENIPLKFRNYPSFNDAKKIVKLKNIKSGSEYKKFVKRENSLPRKPESFYREWKNWGDFLGTGKIADQFLKFVSYEKAKKLIKQFELRTHIEFRKFSQSSEFEKLNIPKHPNQSYSRSNHWKGWGDFLGTGNIGSFRKILTFDKARNFTRSLKLNSFREWEEYKKNNKLPLGMPAGIHTYYSKHRKWKGIIDFLGSNSKNPFEVSKNFFTYDEAKKNIKIYKIKNSRQWREFLKSGQKSDRIPASPDRIYINKGWLGWSDFLSSNAVYERYNFKNIVSYSDLKKIIKNNSIKNEKDWRNFKKSDKFKAIYPRNPQFFYKKKWKGWPDFLGTKTKS